MTAGDRTRTDARLDEKMHALDTTFERFHSGVAEHMRVLHADLTRQEARLDAVQDRLAQIGFGIAAALIAALVTLLATVATLVVTVV